MCNFLKLIPPAKTFVAGNIFLKMNSALTRIPRPRLPEKLKGTIVERWVNYWKGLARDYKGKNMGELKKSNSNFIFFQMYQLTL